MKLLQASLAVSLLCIAAPELGAAQKDDDTSVASSHNFSGNIGLFSDYRFRAISQTYGQPAVQGGFDYAHSGGFYLGTWASNVSGNLYNNGNGMEWDFYGGYKFSPVDALILDLGIYEYVYPGAHFNDEKNTRYNNTEIYLGATYGWFSAKYWYAVTDYFGINEHTYGGYAPIVNHRGDVDASQALPGDRGDSKGSAYLEVNATFNVAEKTVLGLHAGHLDVANYGELSYTDYKLSLAHDFGWATVTAAAITSDARAKWYRYCDSGGDHCKNPAGSTLVLSLSRAL